MEIDMQTNVMVLYSKTKEINVHGISLFYLHITPM